MTLAAEITAFLSQPRPSMAAGRRRPAQGHAGPGPRGPRLARPRPGVGRGPPPRVDAGAVERAPAAGALGRAPALAAADRDAGHAGRSAAGRRRSSRNRTGAAPAHARSDGRTPDRRSRPSPGVASRRGATRGEWHTATLVDDDRCSRSGRPVSSPSSDAWRSGSPRSRGCRGGQCASSTRRGWRWRSSSRPGSGSRAG